MEDEEIELNKKNEPTTDSSIFLTKDNNFTFRSLLGGLLLGSLLCFSNMYFGLQTGWVTMGSLQSSLLGFGLFKVLLRFEDFGPTENVLLQTTAVATATMPLAGGFVGIIPALKEMTTEDGGSIVLSWWQLLLFSAGLAFFGVFFAVPLRRQTILREKLVFPSGTATAELIKILHNSNIKREDRDSQSSGSFEEENPIIAVQRDTEREPNQIISEDTSLIQFSDQKDQKTQFQVLGITFAISGIYVLLSFFLPVLKNIPIFSYIGLPVMTQFMWVITPSFSYVGQGMIMGQKTCLSMLMGAVIGWGILAPMSKYLYWAPGKVSNYTDGATGWILWISLAIMLAESVSSLLVLTSVYVYEYFKGFYLDEELDPAPPEHELISRLTSDKHR